MADITDEEYLDNPLNTQSENPTDEIIPTKDTETILPNQETENMEVHKHPHHVMHKKKWPEYLLEFTMLFLAVFLGFIAENIREKRVEQERGREYIHSIINDLKADTALLASNINRFSKILIRQDSVLISFDKIDKGFNKTFFNNLRSFEGFPDFIYSDATIQQLKYSGGFRLIRNAKVVDSIMAYDTQIRRDMIDENLLGDALTKLGDIQREIFNYKELGMQLNQYKKTELQLEAENFDILFTHDKIILSKFYNHLTNYNGFLAGVKSQKEVTKKIATRLIQFLQQEYAFGKD